MPESQSVPNSATYLSQMTVVILAGGLGTRVREETEFKPKPMIEIGGKPILWHIMKHFSSFGIESFVICVGYKGDVIRDYFLNYRNRNSNFQVDLSKDSIKGLRYYEDLEDKWKVSVIETGGLTATGGRIHKIKDYVDGENFICTYGDGVSDIDVKNLYEFHLSQKRLATVTAVQVQSRFGVLELNNHEVTGFAEKPNATTWVSGGFFVFQKEIFDYLNSNCNLETDILPLLAKRNLLSAYQHRGFWQSMDTYREVQLLNEILAKGPTPWNL